MSFESTSIKPEIEPALDDVSRVLRDAFGIQGTPRRLVGEYDLNYQVDCDDVSYIAKFSRDPAGTDAQRFRNALLAHIHRVDPGLRVPRPVAARNGDETVRATFDGQTLVLGVLTFVSGRPLRGCERSPELLEALGRFMGRLSNAMQGFGHPGAHRQGFLWSLDNAGAVHELVQHIEPAGTRALVERTYDRWHRHVEPKLEALPAAVVHHDANDDNILVDGAGARIGLVDFGDAVFARRVNELAVTLAYALMGCTDISGAACAVIRGYTSVFPLAREEIGVLFDLAATRLAMSLCIASRRGAETPDNDYFQVSWKQAADLLTGLEAMNPRFAHRLARSAAGYPPVESRDAVVSWLTRHNDGFHSPFPFDLRTAPRLVVTLARDAPGTEHADDPVAYEEWLDGHLQAAGARYAIGLYGERREVYTTGQFESAASDQRRSVHLGIDLFVPAGTPLHAPLAGTVVSVRDNAMPLDYGPTVIIEHRCGDHGPPFWTLYGHLGHRSLTMVAAGDRVEAGQAIGEIGGREVNGGWTPHLHFQLITDLLGETGNFHGAGEPANMDVWRAISPDPNLVLGLAPESFRSDAKVPTPEALRERREKLLGPSLSLSYRRKLEIVRGRGAWLYDHTGRAYLDCVNNISHVGHCHPRVVQALHEQAGRLNTNTRYLHRSIVEYAERLLATFPEPLSVCWFVCSGSEANELALRLARNFMDREGILVLDWAYHGNTGGLVDISPYKFKRRGGRGQKPHVHVAELPDPYRGPHKGYGESTAREYVRYVDESIEACRARTGTGPAAMIAESMPGCGGQIVFPDRYLRHAFERVRRDGGVCIADEVQTGFGRVGDATWAFQLQDAVPDIVTLGKPIGNGHPMAAVVTTREIADAFANGMEYFNSFGGNPVSCAVGLSVLDVMHEEGLQAKAGLTGRYLQDRLTELADRHPLIGDVRGRGLFIGIELVEDRETLEPAAETADHVINLLREDGVLLSTDGPHDNVLKLKPPLVFGEAEAAIFCRRLDRALTTLSASHDSGN